MSRRIGIGPTSVFIVLAAALLTSRPGVGREGPQEPSSASTARIVLFDGKSLEGWKKTDFLSAGDVRVEDGTIVMPAGHSMTGITSTRKDLPKTNYDLTYRAMRRQGQDFFAAATFPVGDSFITLVNGGWSGSVTGLSSLDGMDASENETTRTFRYKENTWYRFRVRVTGKMIRCWIDDTEMAAVNHENRRVSTRIETRRSQPLGFASWETTGVLKEIAIRPLTPSEIAETDKFEEE